MAARTSKASRIRALYAKGKSTTQIAGTVGCSVTYARVCAKQRVLNGFRSVWDNAFRMSDEGRAYKRKYMARRRKTDKKFHARCLATEARYRARKRAERMEAHP